MFPFNEKRMTKKRDFTDKLKFCCFSKYTCWTGKVGKGFTVTVTPEMYQVIQIFGFVWLEKVHRPNRRLGL